MARTACRPTAFVIRFPARADANGMEEVALGLTRVARQKGKEIHVDLQGVEFFEPYGITFLALVCRQLVSLGIKPTVLLPLTDTPQAYYLKRMRVPQVLRKWAGLENYLWSQGRGWESSSHVLLELTPFLQAVKIERLIVRRVYQILKTQLHYGPSDLSAFSNIVAELCENVQDHSQESESGFIAAQTYKSKVGSTRGKRCVLLAVVDLGIGIRESLGERYPVSSWSHAVALENAILRNYSRSASRGLGFETVRRICNDHHGHLQVRSGNARLDIHQNRAWSIEGVSFPGAQVAIKLWE